MYHSIAIRNVVWEAAIVTHPEAFKSAMKDLVKASKKVVERLGESDPKIWLKTFFGTHYSIENNISEFFNC